MTTIAVINQKGGVGKTTSTANIGAGLAILGKRVLLVDLDPQSHLGHSLGINNHGNGATVYDVLKGDISASTALVRKELGARIARLQHDEKGHLDTESQQLFFTLLPSAITLAGIDMELSALSAREFRLRDALRSIDGQYDYALIDCAPSLGLLTLNALTAADLVHIPVQTEYLALESLDKLFDTINHVKHKWNPGLEVGGIIATRFDGRKVLNREVVNKLKEHFGSLVFERVIRENIALAEAPSHGLDIFTYRPRSYGAEDYLRLCEEILERSWRYAH
ncbi:MAG: ParA family protein [Candidatus Latescibacterota bacterium]|nr:MAG: ParA family protein [Candidatus Latescibacterota bacterium]